MSLKNRFRAFTALAMLGPLILSAFWLSQERSGILREKQKKVKNLVEAVHSLLAEGCGFVGCITMAGRRSLTHK